MQTTIMKKILTTAFAAFTLAFMAPGLQAQLITNSSFTGGTLAGWTTTGSVFASWNFVNDYALLDPGSISQVFGDGYIGVSGDEITVNWENNPNFNNPTLTVTLFHSGDVANVLFTTNFNLTGSTYGAQSGFSPNSISYTVSGAGIGNTIGVLFSNNNGTAVGIDNVSASVAPIPEPSTYALLALGVGSLWMLRRRCRQA
jgi:hypothetical protein